jgi:hypothetical protein
MLPDDLRVKANSLGYVVPSIEQERLAVPTDEVQALRAGGQK